MWGNEWKWLKMGGNEALCWETENLFDFFMLKIAQKDSAPYIRR